MHLKCILGKKEFKIFYKWYLFRRISSATDKRIRSEICDFFFEHYGESTKFLKNEIHQRAAEIIGDVKRMKRTKKNRKRIQQKRAIDPKMVEFKLVEY